MARTGSKRRTSEQRHKATKLTLKALDDLRRDNQDPGYDYAATLEKLLLIYSYDELAYFFRYKSKASISKIRHGKLTPPHPQGELMYILYRTTFDEEKPPTKGFQE